MLSIGHRPEDGPLTVNTRKGDAVAAPVDLNTLLLQGEEHDQGGNSDGAGEGCGGDAERGLISMDFTIRRNGGHSLVVLGPPGQETPPEEVVEKVGDGDTGPNVGHVVRSPDKSTDQENGYVEVGENLELLAKEVEGDRQNGADEETPQEAIVDGTSTEHPLGTESTPKDGSGEERVVSGTSEVILLLWQTDAGDLGHLVVEDGRADESGDESRPHLAVEGDPRCDVDVVGELEILGEMESVRSRNISVSLEIVHSSGVAREPETTKQLGNNVQGNLDVRDRHDDTARNTEYHSEENCRGL